MFINCAQQSTGQNYFTLIQTVIPRPIAWVLSDNGSGSYNLAPFSFFNAVAADPPLVIISTGWKEEGVRKDTWTNIKEREHFVVHIPSVGHLQSVVASSATLAHGDSEVDQLQISLEPVEGQPLPKVKGPKVALFCEKYNLQEIGNQQQGLILGRVNHIWLDDSIATLQDDRLTVDARTLDPLGRLGGSQYAGLGEILAMKRPQ